MELIVQYLDDLEDLVYAFALKWERIGRIFRFTMFVAASGLAQVLAVVLAIYYPPLATAVAAILLVSLLYRGATTGYQEPLSTS